MKRRRPLSPRVAAYLLGGAISLLVAIGAGRGAFRALDDVGFDWHIRNAGAVQADPSILMIDIDDGSLRAIGDWPWPRRRYAQLVDVLSELQAKSIVLDIVFAEPSPPRVQRGEETTLESGGLSGIESSAVWIDDDAELGDSLRRAGNVFLGMYFESYPPEISPRRVWDAAIALAGRDRAATPEAIIGALQAQFPALRDPDALAQFGGEALGLRARLLDILLPDFELDLGGASSRLQVPADTIEPHWAWAKRAAAGRLAEAFFAAHADANLESFLQSAAPNLTDHPPSADRKDLALAYRTARSLHFVTRRLATVPTAISARLTHAGSPTPPLDLLAEAARGVGFVSFPRERSGGVVRDIPLLSVYRDRLLPQLGLLAAADALGIDPPAFPSENDDEFALPAAAEPRIFTVSKEGTTPIAWHVPESGDDWRDSFIHVPAARLLEIASNRAIMAENRARLGVRTARLIELRSADTPADYADYVRLVNRRLELDRAIDSSDEPISKTREDEKTALLHAIGKTENESLVWLRRAYELWRDATPTGEEETRQREEILDLHSDLIDRKLIAPSDALFDELKTRNDELIAALLPLVRNHVCIVGYTASGVADLVSSPVFASVPGVMAHANVINMALQNRPIARAPGPINALAAALVGLLVTWWTARRGPLASVVAMLLTAGALVSIGAMTFHLTGYHLSSFPAAAGAALVWACVAVLRQFTEERARREFQRALSQYTSPAVASRIAHRARTDDLSPRPAVVTCFFSDLQGFTPLSEKLGAARTRELLNPYLEEMSRVLVAHNAIINKFIGDGIFAFFNAPVLPCADHARASCRCALASIAALDELNALRVDDGMVPPLIMRIGLSTGEVFVGDYGSSAKLDFTCIGDTVNVGARLEAANKALGTAVLVDQTTRDAAGAEFAFRYLGRLLLPGKARPVEAHELSGAMGDRTPVDAEFIARFEQAVRHFQMCEWDLCREDLARCQSLKPDDDATALYLRAVDEAREHAQSDQSGAITITAM